MAPTSPAPRESEPPAGLSVATGTGGEAHPTGQAPAAGGAHRPFARRRSGAVVAGVAGGLADQLRLDVRVVRVLFVVSNLLFGLGLLAYALLWALTPAQAPTTARGGGRRLPVQLLLVGAALVAFGALGATGQNILPELLRPALPVVAVALGAVIAWRDVEAFERQSWLGPGGGRRTLPRVLAGAALAAVGIVVLLTSGQGLAMAWDVGVATAAVIAGVGLVLAPWVAGFWRTYEREQTARIRETERADIAAHLHDSVLQTLALIQRTDDAATASRLARAQERELRAWLYGGAPAGGTLAAEVARAAHEVEDVHGVVIDLVVTGDRPFDEGGDVLVRALREALLNAVRHGRPPVTAYVELGAGAAEAFVRDHGDGFDLQEVAPDRLGVRESILGRMERHGGSARVRRLDEGTEVSLRLPLDAVSGVDGPAGGRTGEAGPAGTPSTGTPPTGAAAQVAAPAQTTDPSERTQETP